MSFKEAAARIALSQGVRPLAGDVEVDVVFFVDHPRDIDGSIKVLFDAMNGIAWNDDAQVKRMGVELVSASGQPWTSFWVGPLLPRSHPELEYRQAVEAVLRRA